MNTPLSNTTCETCSDDSRPLILHLATIATTVTHLLMPQLRELRDAGYRIAVASNPGPEGKGPAEAGITFWPVRIERRLVSPHHLRTVWQLIRLLRSERVHLLHVHTPVAAALGRVAAWFARTPLVFYTAHGFYFHEHMPRRYRMPLIFIERILGRFTDHFFSQSAEDYATAIKSGITHSDRATILGNGVDVDHFARAALSRERVRRELGLGADPVVAFTGRCVREKGVAELLEATALARNAQPGLRLLIIGSSLPSDRDPAEGALAGLIRRLQLHDAVITTGFTDRVADYLGAADIFVLPSYREGMPRSILEAMAAGKPVVATNIRGCREEVVDGVTGYLVPVGDTETLAERIVALVADPPLAARMGAAGQSRAQALFDEHQVHERLLSVYGRYPLLPARLPG